MKNEKIIKEGLTFDDILLIPAHSEVLPRMADVRTKLTKNIAINIPLVSAAMDTVTQSELAMAIAREGGVGIIHKNQSIDAQANEVDKVKRSESGMIMNPITLPPDKSIREAAEVMDKYQISGIPIIEDEKLIGILTVRDLRFETNLNRKITDAMTPIANMTTAPVGTSLEKAQEILKLHKIEKLPLIDEQGHLKGLITIKDMMKKLKYPMAAKDIHGRLLVGAAVGVNEPDKKRIEKLISVGVDVLVVDTAHGHSIGVIEMVKYIKRQFASIDVIAGNIATAEAAQDLIDVGADAVKVGMGPGAICTTRVVSGVGVPQITAIMDCAEVCRKYAVPLIADGGIKQTGDIPKAIAAGADSVMIGNLFAGTEESPGETIFLEGRSHKVYRGMGSIEAMKEGSHDRYFQDDTSKLVPEGIVGRVPYRGALADTVFQMIGGLKAAMGYCGVKNIQELKEKAKFIKISFATIKENHPHSVIITKEAPNYKLLDR
jgi:IMP dehydrogenase